MSLKIAFLMSKNYPKMLDRKNIIVVLKEPHPNGKAAALLILKFNGGCSQVRPVSSRQRRIAHGIGVGTGELPYGMTH